MGHEIEGRRGGAVRRGTGGASSRRHGHERRVEYRSLLQADRFHQHPVRRSHLSSPAIRAGKLICPEAQRPLPKSNNQRCDMNEAVIVSTARTGVGKAYRGALNNTERPTMAGHVIAEAVKRARIEPGEVEDGGMGSARHQSTMWMNGPR